jgi:hypothetical protein
MKRINLLIPALILLAVACKNKPKTTPDAATGKDSLENKSYMPVADFIRNDITRVDSFAGGIVRKITVNGKKKDSAFIQLPTFHQLASQFLLPELDSASFHGHFTESSLMDETTQMIQFIYSGKQNDWPLRNVMVYVKPSLNEDQVSRVYMERDFTSGDTTIQQRFTWKMQEYFYIITMKQPKTGPAVTTMDKVIWDPEFFSE